MRDVKRTVGLAAIMAAVAVLAACGFVLPQRGRENPADPNSAVALVTGFTATPTFSADNSTVSIAVSWTVPAASATQAAPTTVVIVRSEAAQPRTRDDGTAIGPVAASDGTYSDTGVATGKVYWYGVWCSADDVTYVGPAYVQVSTAVVSPLATFAAAATAPDTVRLTWTLPTTNVPASIVVVKKADSDPTSPTDGTQLPVVMADGLYVDVVGVGNVYSSHYAAWARDASGARNVGPLLAGVTAATVSPVASLTAVAVTATTVQLTWTLPATNPPSALAVYRKEGSAPTSRTDGVVVPVVLPNLQAVDTVLSDKVYYYTAWGLDAAGLVYAGPASATASTVLPSNVSGFYATAVSGTQVNLTWTVPSTNAPSSIIVVRKEGAAPGGPSDGTALGVTLASGSFADTTVTASRNYYYAVWAYNSSGYLSAGPSVDYANTGFGWTTLSPVTDGYVSEYMFMTDFTGQYLWISNANLVGAGGNDFMSLFRFAGLPAQVLSAYLVMYQTGGAYGSAYTATVERIQQDWTTSVTPSVARGASFVSTAGAVTAGWPSTEASVDVTTIAQAWASGTANYGLRMRANAAFLAEKSLASNEYSSSSSRPYLKVYRSNEFQ